MPQSGRTRSGKGTRPTTDRVREALFNVLAADVDFPGSSVLDLYAGSGRLAGSAVREVRHLRCSSSRTGVRQRSSRLTSNVCGVTGAAVRSRTRRHGVAGGADRPADLVFADPPYEVPAADVESVLAELAESAAGCQRCRRGDRARRVRPDTGVAQRLVAGATAATATLGWSSATSARRAPVHARRRAEIA